jgi:hypothetical protein
MVQGFKERAKRENQKTAKSEKKTEKKSPPEIGVQRGFSEMQSSSGREDDRRPDVYLPSSSRVWSKTVAGT